LNDKNDWLTDSFNKQLLNAYHVWDTVLGTEGRIWGRQDTCAHKVNYPIVDEAGEKTNKKNKIFLAVKCARIIKWVEVGDFFCGKEGVGQLGYTGWAG
jgi:hypothetical protein